MPDYFERGMFVRKPAWHQMGNVVEFSPKSWKEARKAAGMDQLEIVGGPVYGFEGMDASGGKVYSPDSVVLPDKVKREINAFIRAGEVSKALEAMGVLQIEDKQRTLRTDTGSTLGVPSSEYEIINLDELGEITEALTTAVGKGKSVTYETFIMLEGGKSVVVVTYLDEPVKLPGDQSVILPYLAISTRNDGAGAARAQSTSVRVVCANTRAMSDNEADKNGTVFTFRHGANWRDRLEEATQTILGLRKDFAENIDFLKTLAKIKVTPEQRKDWLEQFIPMPLSAAEVTDRQARTIEEARQTVMAILNSDTCNGIRGSAYGLLAAGDEFLDHYRGLNAAGEMRNKELYVRRTLLEPEARKLRQVEIIKSVVGLAA